MLMQAPPRIQQIETLLRAEWSTARECAEAIGSTRHQAVVLVAALHEWYRLGGVAVVIKRRRKRSRGWPLEYRIFEVVRQVRAI